MWPDTRILDLLGIELPIIQAPMAGFVSPEMVIGVSDAGGLGSLPAALLVPDQLRAELGVVRQRTARPVNVNFFCHRPPRDDPSLGAAWRQRLAAYAAELGIAQDAPSPSPSLVPFDAAACDLLAALAPPVVSFHFGLPEPALLRRVRATGAKILSSATTVEEARRLEAEGCDAIIAQGAEAGGHRGMFLGNDVATQMGTLALVPQAVDAVKLPVIAAGGIADGRAIAAAFMLGAAAVQVGTAYLFCPEAKIGPLHRRALAAKGSETIVTNVLTGRPARVIANRVVREIGPLSDAVPDFPLAGAALAPLRAAAEATGSDAFTAMYAGQAAALGRALPAGELTRQLAADALARLRPR
jgi:nitronate monooxygenase